MELVVFVTVVVLLAAIAHYFTNRKFNAIVDKIPGPTTTIPFLGDIWDLYQKNFELIRIQGEFADKYGPIFRIRVGNKVHVFLLDPSDIEALLSSNKHIEKAQDYSLLHSWIGRGLLTSTGKKWHTRRKLITPTFHFKILEQFVDVFHKNSTIMAQKFLEQKGPFDVYKLMSLCTLDIICETAMGTSMNAQVQSDSEYVKAVNSACMSLFKRVIQVWLKPSLVFNLSSTGRLYNKSVDIMHHTTEEVIRKRQEERAKQRLNGSSTNTQEDDIGAKKKTAFLDHLLDANDAAGSVMTDLDIREEVDTFMFEGHDTTSAALTFALYLLAKNPDVQTKAAQEVYEILGDVDSGRHTTHQDLQRMNYIERVIKETLRIYPSVPDFARETSEELVLPSGYVIPPGVSVNVSCFRMGYNAAVFPDPEKFDPDRFLPENTTSRHPFSYAPFSAGPRNCVGQKFAMLEMKSTISNVLRHCELSLPSPDYKPKVLGMVVLKIPDGMLIQAKPRTFAS